MGTTSLAASTKAEELGVKGGASSRARFSTHHESVAFVMEGDTMPTSLTVLGACGLDACGWNVNQGPWTSGGTHVWREYLKGSSLSLVERS